MSDKVRPRWVRFRHRVIRRLAGLVIVPYCRIVYHVELHKLIEKTPRQYLILMNHQTAADQFFVGATFPGPVYYVASEDLFSNGWASSLLRYAVAPIPIKKQTFDLKAIRICMRVAKEGGSICIAPEGNRTFAGRNCTVKPSIAKLARMFELPIVLFRIEGGYGVHPRWSDVVRKGRMRAVISRIVEPEEYLGLSNDELFELIMAGLTVDETRLEGTYRHRRNAEFLERAIYVCPTCGLSRFETHDDIIECTSCHARVRHLPDKHLEGVGGDFPFGTVADWYDYQESVINALDTREHADEPLFEDHVSLYEVVPYERKNRISRDATLALYGDRVVVESEETGTMRLAFEEAHALTVLGKNKLDIYVGDRLYQVKGGKRFNALKYVNLFNRHRNILSGDEDGKFLGL